MTATRLAMMVVVPPVMVMAVMMMVARHDAHVRDIAVMMPMEMVMSPVLAGMWQARVGPVRAQLKAREITLRGWTM